MPFDGIVNAAHDIVMGKVRGRLVVEMHDKTQPLGENHR
jgi:hypothetical protein